MKTGYILPKIMLTHTIKNNTCISKGRILVEEPAWEYKIIDESEWRIEQTDEL